MPFKVSITKLRPGDPPAWVGVCRQRPDRVHHLRVARHAQVELEYVPAGTPVAPGQFLLDAGPVFLIKE